MGSARLYAILVGCLCGVAQVHSQTPARGLDEVVVTARRPMKEIGVQKTEFDSLRLKESIALSMADVLTFNSSVFVKGAGRASLSTVAFRGTSPSHTQVTWNGLRINSPMLGMTDFSTIPAFFIDRASLLHGSSSISQTGGGLGGLVSLATAPPDKEGLGVSYIQGVGSFSTFDEFLRVDYGKGKWRSSTRVAYASSPNDYTYVNRDKKVNEYGWDEDGNKIIINQYHPKEKNRSAAYKDFNAMQEVWWSPRRYDRLGLSAWLTVSNRELPMLSTDYGEERGYENRQRENTLRSVLSWNHRGIGWNTDVRAGYIHSWLGYDYRREAGSGVWSTLTRSRSRVNSFYAKADADWSPRQDLFLSASFSAQENLVRSRDGVPLSADDSPKGFDRSRLETSLAATARWQPVTPLGVAASLRQETSGAEWAAPAPAFFIDWMADSSIGLMLKASASRNHKFPSLNDLYFLPGGNPDLRPEHGWSYDAGASIDLKGHRLAGRPYALSGGVTWFDSRIEDWILWLPTFKGFFSPRNVKTVHAYGVEARADWTWDFADLWKLDMGGSYSWTPSINVGDPMGDGDKSVGKQLPYVPRHSASASARLTWKEWEFLYKWMWYSERYTMSSNEHTLTGSLPAYTVSNVTLERRIPLRICTLSLKLAVNNIFDAEYLSILSRPMPGANFEVFISITI